MDRMDEATKCFDESIRLQRSVLGHGHHVRRPPAVRQGERTDRQVPSDPAGDVAPPPPGLRTEGFPPGVELLPTIDRQSPEDAPSFASAADESAVEDGTHPLTHEELRRGLAPLARSASFRIGTKGVRRPDVDVCLWRSGRSLRRAGRGTTTRRPFTSICRRWRTNW